MKISSKLWRISSATVIFSPLFLFASVMDVTRIGKAQELMMKGESLSTVAAATGFADQSHFTRTFKRVTGATPHDWRQDRTPMHGYK